MADININPMLSTDDTNIDPMLLAQSAPAEKNKCKADLGDDILAARGRKKNK